MYNGTSTLNTEHVKERQSLVSTLRSARLCPSCYKVCCVNSVFIWLTRVYIQTIKLLFVDCVEYADSGTTARPIVAPIEGYQEMK